MGQFYTSADSLVAQRNPSGIGPFSGESEGEVAGIPFYKLLVSQWGRSLERAEVADGQVIGEQALREDFASGGGEDESFFAVGPTIRCE